MSSVYFDTSIVARSAYSGNTNSLRTSPLVRLLFSISG